MRATRAVVLSPRQISDLDLLLNGGFSPLRGFLGRADYESVLDTMRLESGLLWPIPVTLDMPEAAAVWRPDKRREAEVVYGTASDTHPGVRYLYEQAA